jgi:hypothetical protein
MIVKNNRAIGNVYKNENAVSNVYKNSQLCYGNSIPYVNIIAYWTVNGLSESSPEFEQGSINGEGSVNSWVRTKNFIKPGTDGQYVTLTNSNNCYIYIYDPDNSTAVLNTYKMSEGETYYMSD